MKKGPIILITFLISIALFILGLQYGKHVERDNNNIALILSSTPSPTIPPEKDTPLTFAKYTHEGCGIGFPKPVEFKTINESTLGATLQYNKQIIAFECPLEQVKDLEYSDKRTATTSVILNSKKIQGYAEGQNVRFIVDHEYRKTPVIFSIDNNLLPLIQSSLEFVK